MALKVYCPHCGTSHEYTAIKPTSCKSCSKEFSKGYVNQAPSLNRPPIGRDPEQPIVVAPVTSGRVIARHSRPIASEDEESDYYDKDTVTEMAREMAASLTAEDIGISLKPIGGGGFSLKDVLDPTKNIEVGHRAPVVTELLPQAE